MSMFLALKNGIIISIKKNLVAVWPCEFCICGYTASLSGTDSCRGKELSGCMFCNRLIIEIIVC